MTSYGPWIQAPDFEAPATTITKVGIDEVAEDGATVYQPGPPASAGMVQGVINGSRGKWSGESHTWHYTTGMLLASYQHTAGGFPDARMLYGAKREYGLSAFTAKEADMSDFPDPAASAPPGALGYEWEPNTPKAVVVSAVLNTGFRQISRDTTNNFGPVNGDWETFFKVATSVNVERNVGGYYHVKSWHHGLGATLAVIPGDADGKEGHLTLDVTGHLEGGPEWGIFAFAHDVDGTFAFTDYGLQYGSIGVGASAVVPIVTYTMRPMRYRYLFASAVTRPRIPPPLRQWPRSDGRGLSSANRIVPGPRSRQGSNRRGPASYL